VLCGIGFFRTLLFLGFFLGGLLQGRSLAELASRMVSAARRLGVVALALAAMLGLSRVLVHSGMIDALAQAAAATGALWPFLAPFIGVLGSFVTGSATSSNILFTDFQRATATALSLPAAALHGAQNFGAGIGNIISPHNIIAGAATVGLPSEREGEVMRATILVCLVYAASGGLLTYLMTRGGAALF
jgi:lactate permease